MTQPQCTAWDLLRVESIKKFLVENPKEAGPVFDQVMMYLESGNEAQARYKIMLDSDKFLDMKLVLQFMDRLDLLDPEYRERLVRWGGLLDD